MNKLFTLLLISFTSLILIGCSTTIETTLDNTSNGEEEGSSGELYITVTDAAANMDAVTRVDATIANAQVYSETQGWVDVQSEEKTYNLLEYRNGAKQAFIGNANISAQEYSKVRFDLESIVITHTNGTTQESEIIRKDFEFDQKTSIKSNTTNTLLLDIIVDESLHKTEEGEYVFATVVKSEAKSNVNVDASNEADVKTNGGSVISATKVGTDIDGNIGVGLSVPLDAKISLSLLGGVSLLDSTTTTGIDIGIDTSSTSNTNNSSASIDSQIKGGLGLN
ncbi:MAG: DUF4382 domain-containing protein [Nanoarchaeota archaeon]|nr:DUF4382 domain-containing protein [Nanoarchaeota archaeon]